MRLRKILGVIILLSLAMIHSSLAGPLKFPLTIGGFYGDTKIEDLFVGTSNMVIAGESNDSGVVGTLPAGVSWIKYVLCFDYASALDYVWKVQLPSAI